MTAISFAPAPGSAPPLRRVWRHAMVETRLLARNGEQLLLALLIPVGLLVGGRLLGLGEPASWTASVIGVAIWSSSFTSVAIATGFERRYGVLERLAATPLGRSGLIAGKSGAVALVLLGQVLVLVAVGLGLGWRPAWSPLAALLTALAVVLAVAVFVCLGLLLAGRLRAEVTLGLANLLYLLLLLGGGLVVPVAGYPEAAQPVIAALPTAALGEALRAGAVGQVLWWPLPVLGGWLLAAALAAGKGFRWMS